MDEIQQPTIMPNPATYEVAPLGENKKEESAPYILEGLVVGVIIAVAIIGGLYYKSKISSVLKLQTGVQIQNQTKATLQTGELSPTQQQILQPTQQTVNSIQTTTVTPILVKTKQDLTTQQTALLDNTEMTSITKGLEENTADSSQFAL